MIKVVMQGKLFQSCTHHCTVLSLGGNVNTRRTDVKSLTWDPSFTLKKSMEYSGHIIELSKLSKINAFNLLGY